MPKLKKQKCCCGATKSNPCACMKQGIMNCSKSEPKCQCYKDLDMKKAFDGAWDILMEVR